MVNGDGLMVMRVPGHVSKHGMTIRNDVFNILLFDSYDLQFFYFRAQLVRNRSSFFAAK